MLDAPIRKRAKNYPKDFTPPTGYFDSKPKPTHPQSEPIVTQTSHIRHNNFSRPRLNPHSLTTSTQLLQNQAQKQSTQLLTKNVITLNPQQNNYHRNFKQDTERQTPLVNLHLGKRTMYINPELLRRPKIQDNQEQQLIQKQDEEIQEGSPGSIKKNCYQKPLSQQKPTFVQVPNIPNKQAFSTKKLQSNQNSFYQSVKSQYANFNNIKSKKWPSFLRNGESQPSGSFRLAKRSQSLIQPRLQTQKEKNQKSEEKRRLLEYGALLEQSKVDKLKAHINQIAFAKSKNKQRIAQNNQTQGDYLQNKHDKHHSSYKTRPKTNFFPNSTHLDLQYPQLGQGQITDRINRFNQSHSAFQINQPFNFSRVQSNEKNIKKMVISYKKTSLTNLKQIYSSISRIQAADIEVQIPNILMNLFFDRNLQKSQLYMKAIAIFQNLGIPTENMTVKRYSNCIMMLSKNICILWHYDGKIYLGSWQIKYLDEGFKHGLGLQWVPGKYVYYGQFAQSKKQGLGIMKTQNQSFIGEWVQSKKTNNGYIVSRNGNIFNCKNQNNNFNYNNNNYNYHHQRETQHEGFDRDPFV